MADVSAAYSQKMDAGARIEDMKLNVQSSTSGSLTIAGQACGSTIPCGNVVCSSMKKMVFLMYTWLLTGTYTLAKQSCLVYEAIGVGVNGTYPFSMC